MYVPFVILVAFLYLFLIHFGICKSCIVFTVYGICTARGPYWHCKNHETADLY